MITRLGLGQRVVLVVALAFALAIVGLYITTLGSPNNNFGWFGYAPMPGITVLRSPDLSPFEQFLVWLGLVVLWAAASVLILKPSPVRSPGD